MKVGGFERHVDYERLGSTVVIAAAVILAVRTARQATGDKQWYQTDREMEGEVSHAVKLAHMLLTAAITSNPAMFPHKDVPWYVPTEDEVQP